jgi:hypothetical protein
MGERDEKLATLTTARRFAAITVKWDAGAHAESSGHIRRPAQGGAAGGAKQLEGSLRERVRCSSLVDWPVYPRRRRTMEASSRSRNSARPMAAGDRPDRGWATSRDGGSLILSDVRGPTFAIVCDASGPRGRYDVERRRQVGVSSRDAPRLSEGGFPVYEGL